MVFVPAIPQDPAYHNFADQRIVMGIPGFWNAVSNVFFLIVGMLGVTALLGNTKMAILEGIKSVYVVFFVAVFLVGVGSGYYHLRPTDATLVWDRVPMAIAFMAFFTIVISEFISEKAGKMLFIPLVLFGLFSVGYWHLTELKGDGDLRLYVLVQFLPMVLIPLTLLLFPPRFSHIALLWAVLGVYLLSKIAEMTDATVYLLLGGVSGHTLKHLFSALAAYLFLLFLKRRKPGRGTTKTSAGGGKNQGVSNSRKRFYIIGVMFTLFGSIAAASDAEKSDLHLETPVCGLKEPFVFWLWSSAAGSADASRVAGEPSIEEIVLRTIDGRILRGYKLKADAETPKGYLLVAQGNAMLADQIILSFKSFATAGYDVYIYDYRGYGRSEGKRRLKAMLSDYQEIIGSLDALSYEERRFYGMSFGGILLLNALKEDDEAKKIVIDSTPSRLSGYGCPERYDPINTLPPECSELFMIGGMADPVVPPASSNELRERARSRGAAVLLDPGFSHPFMDRSVADHQRRMDAVRTFLIEQPES